ncbi:MAG: hypothetical protein SGARI_002480 [Bacillariaceae sp.]
MKLSQAYLLASAFVSGTAVAENLRKNPLARKGSSEDEMMLEYGSRASLADCLVAAVKEPGYVVLPEDPDYRDEANVHSKFWIGYPKAIAVPSDEESIGEVMACGLEYGVPIVPRCGGHGGSGNSATTGSVIVKLNLMNNVTLSDDMSTVAVGAGNTAGQAAYWLGVQSDATRALPIGQKPSVGIAGLALGGGYGFLTRYAGLLCDRIVSLRAVLTDGEIVVATLPQTLTWYEHFEISVAGPEGLENIQKYQKLAMAIDTRTTMNLEAETAETMKMTGTKRTYTSYVLASPNHGTHPFLPSVAGIFLGSKDEFLAALDAADPGETLFSHSEDAWMPEEGSFIDAALALSGWNTTDPEDLLELWLSERKYYNYKGWFTEADSYLNNTALEILVDYLDPANGQVWEFQAMGGGNSSFSAVGDEDTAFSHRGSYFAVNMKSTATDRELGDERWGAMSRTMFDLSDAGFGAAAYVNHADLEIWDWKSAYYGIHTHPHDSKDFYATIANLEDINEKYDPVNLMAGHQLF